MSSGIQSSSNIGRRQGEIATPSRRKDSSINRKMERISSTSRKKNDLDEKLDKEMEKIKSKMGEDDGVQEILKMEEDPSMELDENLDNVGKNIKELKYGDLSGKVDALVIINELITMKMDEAADSLVRNANFLIDSISKVLYDVFNKSTDKVPLKFGKYFLSIVNKVCSIKEIMKVVDERRILILVEQLLLKLLIPGLDTLGEKHEGQAMFRNLNNTILRILENCNPTEVFVVFLTLLKKYKSNSKIEKLNGIIVKCLLKITRIMDQIIDKISIERILLATHEYLLTKPAANSSKTDEVGIRITKTIVNELVKLKKEEIWDYYDSVDAHSTQDVYIKKWIEIILMSLSGGAAIQRPSTASAAQQRAPGLTGLEPDEEQTLKSLVNETQ
jgi:cytoskeleton-associated protein 5